MNCPARKIAGFLLALFIAAPWGGVSALPDEQAAETPGKNAALEKAPAASSRISLDLKNIDLMELLRILSIKTGKTIVPSKDINGRITTFLNNVTFEDALDIILVSQGLACDRKNDIVYIMTNNEYKSLTGNNYREPRKMVTIKLKYAKPANVFNAISQLKSDIGKIVVDEASGTIILIDIPGKLVQIEKAVKNIDRPLDMTVYDLNYAKPSDAKAQLTAAITPGTGEVIIDERSGKAIVSDLPQKMHKINRLVKEIDEETRQVFLECEIVQITLSDSFQRGINWEKVFNQKNFNGLDLVGNFTVSSTLSNYGKINVGTLASNNYTAVINFLNSYGETRILSQPRISIVNHEESKLMVGVKDAYVTQTLSQGSSTTVTSEQVEFVDVGVKLNVTPTISKDGFIIMKIKPEVSSVQETLTTSLGSVIPIVETSEAETVIKVKDGTMVMLGGLLQRTNSDTIKGVPGLSKLPLIGSWFGSREKEKKTTELVIFITPHLIRGDSSQRSPEFDQYISGPAVFDRLRSVRISDSLDRFEQAAKNEPGKISDQDPFKRLEARDKAVMEEFSAQNGDEDPAGADGSFAQGGIANASAQDGGSYFPAPDRKGPAGKEQGAGE